MFPLAYEFFSGVRKIVKRKDHEFMLDIFVRFVKLGRRRSFIINKC